jgi:hypothetical protein
MQILVASAIGAASMGVVGALAFAATQRTGGGDMSKITRNSFIASALAIGVGLWVAKKKNLLWGAAIATSGAAMIIGTKVSSFVGGLLSKPTTPAIAAVYGNMGAYHKISGYQRAMQAVFGDMGQVNGYARKMNAVYGDMGRMGRLLPPGRPQNGFVPSSPWQAGANPFG